LHRPPITGCPKCHDVGHAATHSARAEVIAERGGEVAVALSASLTFDMALATPVLSWERGVVYVPPEIS